MIVSSRKIERPLIAILSLVFFVLAGNTAFADYVPVQHAGGAGQLLFGTDDSESVEYLFVATTTASINMLTVPVYASTSDSGYVRAFTGGHDNPRYIATSSGFNLNVNSSQFPGATINTIFSFIPPIQFSPGVTIGFEFRGGVQFFSFGGNSDAAIYPVYGRGVANSGHGNSSWYLTSYSGNFTTNMYGDIPVITVCSADNPNCSPVPPALPNCSITDIGACVGNALAWAFQVPGDEWDKFSTLKDDIKNKPPFGYFTSAAASIAGISGTSTRAFSLATSSPIMTYIFSPLRAGLVWLLGIASLLWLYKLLTKINI
jgi:hypothetical protein